MGMHKPTLYHGHALTMVELGVIHAVEEHAKENVGSWFQPADVFRGNEGIQPKKRAFSRRSGGSLPSCAAAAWLRIARSSA